VAVDVTDAEVVSMLESIVVVLLDVSAPVIVVVPHDRGPAIWPT